MQAFRKVWLYFVFLWEIIWDERSLQQQLEQIPHPGYDPYPEG